MKTKIKKIIKAKNLLKSKGETIKHDKALLKVTNDLLSAEQYVDEDSKDMNARLVYASRISNFYSLLNNNMIETAIEKGYANAEIIEKVYNAFRTLDTELDKMADDIIATFEAIE